MRFLTVAGESIVGLSKPTDQRTAAHSTRWQRERCCEHEEGQAAHVEPDSWSCVAAAWCAACHCAAGDVSSSGVMTLFEEALVDDGNAVGEEDTHEDESIQTERHGEGRRSAIGCVAVVLGDELSDVT